MHLLELIELCTLKRVNFTTYKLYLNKFDIVKEVRGVAKKEERKKGRKGGRKENRKKEIIKERTSDQISNPGGTVGSFVETPKGSKAASYRAFQVGKSPCKI